jgi:hypothetical protein
LVAVKRGSSPRRYALGFDTGTEEDVNVEVDFGMGRTVSFYLGPNPPLGIMTLEGVQYVIPGRTTRVLHTDNTYESSCFWELAIFKRWQVDDRQMELLKNQDQETRESLLAEAGKDPELQEYILDAFSGLMGLRMHRQLVLSPLIENRFLAGDFETVNSFTGPPVEVLESLQPNAKTETHVRNLLEGMIDTPEDALRQGGGVLYWLLKAWREKDAISKFMYLFIPLEAVLPGTRDETTEVEKELSTLAEIVRSSDATNKDHLLGFLDRARARFGPTLNARFEKFAREAAIPGWEADVKAFKKFNRMRNVLLHSGSRHVRSHVHFEETTRTLEDLVERYVSVALLRTSDVYLSNWRPERETVA